MKIKAISGIMWAADILNGGREFPTFNKEDAADAPQDAETGADFGKVFSDAMQQQRAKMDVIRKRQQGQQDKPEAAADPET